MNFQQTHQLFRRVSAVSGLALFDKGGDMIDTSLPFSDELCEEIGARFLSVIEQCHNVGRTDNHFVIEYGNSSLVFAEHASGYGLFLLRDSAGLDELLAQFNHFYRNSPAIAPKAVEKEVFTANPIAARSQVQLGQTRNKKPLIWGATGFVTAVALAAAVPSYDSGLEANESGVLISAESQAAEVAAMKAEEEMRLKKVAMLAAEEEARRLEKEEMMKAKALKEAEMKAEAERVAMKLAKEKAEAEAAAKAQAEEEERQRLAEEARKIQEAEAAAAAEAKRLEKERAAKAAKAAKAKKAKKKYQSRKKSSRKKRGYTCNN